MAILGDLEHVKQMLRASEGVDLGPDADDRLERIQATITALIEHKTGIVFGATVEDTTAIAWGADSEILLLPVPARAVTSVTTGGTWDGTVYAGGAELDIETWEPWTIDNATGLIWSLRLRSGAYWGGVDLYNRPVFPVVIVGDFTDSDDDAVIPADVQYAADRLIAAQYQRENASPTGFIGPDGGIQVSPSAWNDDIVKQVLDRYGAATKALVF
jgi:hypothetical protein